MAKESGRSKGSVIDMDSRLELFVDDFLIDRMSRTRLQLHHPTPKDVAILFDAPWEGNTCCYYRVFRDGDLFRMYYRGSDYDHRTEKASEQFACYAESKDGIHWTKPNLGLFDFNGSKKNNIVWKGFGTHNFAPFKDEKPGCKRSERYKALAGYKRGLAALKSADGLHWSLMHDEPVITRGAFDSQNLAFWDTVRGRYVDFHRQGRKRGRNRIRVRDIMTCTSPDFIDWTEPEWISYGNAPAEHLYTNAITPYPRAPHIFMGFPKRFVPSRQSQYHIQPGVSDGVFMTSRDGKQWKRWGEAFIRPGLLIDRWANRNNMTAWGLLLTQSDVRDGLEELSLFSSEGYYVKNCRLRRFTLRLDGFVSVQADRRGGEMVTKPLKFRGRKLVINYSTSAAGSISVELQDAKGRPIKGFTSQDCGEIFGDEVEEVVKWSGKSDLSKLSGKPVRIRFVVKDADLYSMQFRTR